MKKLLLSLSVLITINAVAQSVDEIVQKYSANMGGLDAFNKITTAKITGTYSTQGSDFPLSIQIINGKAMRTDVDINGQPVTNCYYNGKAWKINPFAGATDPTEVTGTELNDFKAQSFLGSSLMDYKARGHKIALAGEDNVEGVKVFKIKLTAKEDGKETTYYISQVDYSLVKLVYTREIQGQEMEVESYYSEPKEINGLKFFMARNSEIEGQVFQTIKFEKVELNVPIDEKIFEMPK